MPGHASCHHLIAARNPLATDTHQFSGNPILLQPFANCGTRWIPSGEMELRQLAVIRAFCIMFLILGDPAPAINTDLHENEQHCF